MGGVSGGLVAARGEGVAARCRVIDHARWWQADPEPGRPVDSDTGKQEVRLASRQRA